MHQNSNFRLSLGHQFFPKNGSFGYSAKSQWGPPKVHLGANGVPLGKKKWVKTVKNYHAAIFEFSTAPQSSIFRKKKGSYGYSAKSRWGPPSVQLGANGVPLGRKTGQNRKTLQCLKIRIFDYPEVIDLSQKMEVTVMVPNHGGDPLGSDLGPMGSHWVLKMGQNRKKLPCRKIRIFDCPAVFHFRKKNGSYGYSAKSRWGPPSVQLWANGVPLGRKTGQNRKTLQCLKIRIFNYPEVIDLSQKMEVTVMVPNHGGDPLGSDLGPMGSHWVEKLVKTVKHYNASKFEFSTTPRSSIFQKNGSYGYGAKSRWGLPRVHLGANGVPLGRKIWSKP